MTLEPHDHAFARFASTGRPAELAAVFDATADELRRVARYLARDADEADDLLQSTFLAAIEHRGEFDVGEPVLPWLLGILANRARRLGRMRRRQPDPRRVEPPQALDDPLRAASRDELHRALDRALTTLPEPYGPLLSLHLVEGLGAQEIATRVHRPAGSVRKQLSRGMERLRQALPAGLAGAATVSVSLRSLAAVRTAVLAAATTSAVTTTAVATGAGISVGRFALGLVAVGLAVATVATLALQDETVSPVLERRGVIEPKRSEDNTLAAAGETETVSGRSPFARDADDVRVDTPGVERAIPSVASSSGLDEAPEAATVFVPVHGRVRLPDGSAAAAQDLQWMARRTGDESAPLDRFLLRCDAEGRFTTEVPRWRAGFPPTLVIADDERRLGAQVPLPHALADGAQLGLGTVTLRPAPRLVAGRVIGDDGDSHRNFRVTIREAIGRGAGGAPVWLELGSCDVERNGSFEFARWSVAPRLQVVVALAGREFGAPLECAPGSSDLELRLAAPGRIDGRIDGLPELPFGTLSWTMQHDREALPTEGPVAVDGTFGHGPLRPGRYAIAITSQRTKEVLADLGIVDVPEAGAAAHPQLDGFRLDPATRFVHLRVVDAQGRGITGYYIVHARPAGGDGYVATTGEGAVLHVPTRTRGFDLILAAAGRRKLELVDVTDDRTLAWPAAIAVRVAVDATSAELPRGTRLFCELLLLDEQRVRSEGNLQATFAPGSSAELSVDTPGRYELHLLLVTDDDRFVFVDGAPARLATRQVVVRDDDRTIAIDLAIDSTVLARVKQAGERR